MKRTARRAAPAAVLAAALGFVGAGCEGEGCPDAEAGAWCDEAGGLCWEDPPADARMSREEAMLHCAGLRAGGYDDWRVPDIDELRTLVRGCPAVAPGGSCAITDGSALGDWTAACQGCQTLGGPGSGGCYWPSALGGECARYYRSSSVIEDEWGRERCWAIWFAGPYLYHWHVDTPYLYVRCVRGGEA